MYTLTAAQAKKCEKNYGISPTHLCINTADKIALLYDNRKRGNNAVKKNNACTSIQDLNENKNERKGKNHRNSQTIQEQDHGGIFSYLLRQWTRS